MTRVDSQNKAKCHLCLRTDGNHTPEYRATRVCAVPLFYGKAWRAGVRATKKVMKAKEKR